MGSSQSTEDERQNDPEGFFRQIAHLPAQHQSAFGIQKRYKLYLYKYSSFGSHHGVVVRDVAGELKDVIFHINAIPRDPDANREEKGEDCILVPLLEVFTFNPTKLQYLEVEKDTSLLHLTDAASRAFKKMKETYNIMTNNCQKFCVNFLAEISDVTYWTDAAKAAKAAEATGATSVVMTGLMCRK